MSCETGECGCGCGDLVELRAKRNLPIIDESQECGDGSCGCGCADVTQEKEERVVDRYGRE